MDRKRRFNEAIVDLLFPSPPKPQLEAFVGGSAFDVISGSLDDSDNTSTSGMEEHDSEAEKLTRAQRKNIRKKRLKEEAVLRGKLIGPLLPLTPTQVPEDPPAVRSNASQKGDEAASTKLMKVKHRRMAKRLAKQKQNASSS